MSKKKLITRRPIQRQPTKPHKHLQEVLGPKPNLTQLAAKVKMSRRTMSTMYNGRRSITAVSAVKLEKLTGVSAEAWMNIQTAHDLWKARKRTR